MAKKSIVDIFKEIFLNRKAAVVVTSGCNKVVYDTQNEAVKAARGVAKSSKHGMRAYKCTSCFKWHISSIRSKNLRPKTAKKLKYPFRYDRKRMDDS